MIENENRMAQDTYISYSLTFFRSGTPHYESDQDGPVLQRICTCSVVIFEISKYIELLENVLHYYRIVLLVAPSSK